MKNKNIKIVIGANFGDEGKGLVTDYLISLNHKSIVVLHNGGCQRAHTVVTPEGYRHIFRHIGSGTFQGADTYISSDFIVNPIIFRQEYEKLAKYIKMPKIYVSPNCKLTTIYDMLLNQIFEIDRGKNKHGSCGLGIYETLHRNQQGLDFVCNFEYSPLSMTVGEFSHLSTISQINFLDFLRKDYVLKRFNEFHLKGITKKEFEKVLTSSNVIMNFIDDFIFFKNNTILSDSAILNNYEEIIFENGQGLLLDQYNKEYFPNLSPSNTGIKNPLKILKYLGYEGDVETFFVSRTYMTRHGVGKFKTECSKDLINENMVDITNVPNPFQDDLRYGFLDVDELKARMDLESRNSQGIPFVNSKILFKKNLVLTHINEYDKSINECYRNLSDSGFYVSNGLTRQSIKKWR